MSDGDPPCGELPSEFESALKKLKGLFAGALPSLEHASRGAFPQVCGPPCHRGNPVFRTLLDGSRHDDRRGFVFLTVGFESGTAR